MIQFRNLYFPDGEKILPEHMAAAGNIEIAGGGTYQAPKLIKALPYVKNFRHAVDVGANVGTWARVLARLFTKVDAFEPIERFRECLALNIHEADRANVTIHDCALGSEEGELEMRVSSGSSGWTHAVPTDKKGAKFLEDVHAKQNHGPLDFQIQKAQVKTLDSFDLPRIDFLKIDVEGFEYHVLKGGAKTIARDHPTVIVEQKPGTPDRYGLPATGAVKFLQGLGATLAFEFSGDYCLYWK